jgi:hypothetical protein
MPHLYQTPTKLWLVSGVLEQADLARLLADQLEFGWKLKRISFDPTPYRGRGETRLEFEYFQLPEEEPDEDYYDWEADAEYFEYDDDTKASYWHGQRIS